MPWRQAIPVYSRLEVAIHDRSKYLKFDFSKIDRVTVLPTVFINAVLGQVLDGKVLK